MLRPEVAKQAPLQGTEGNSALAVSAHQDEFATYLVAVAVLVLVRVAVSSERKAIALDVRDAVDDIAVVPQPGQYDTPHLQAVVGEGGEGDGVYFVPNEGDHAPTLGLDGNPLAQG